MSSLKGLVVGLVVAGAVIFGGAQVQAQDFKGKVGYVNLSRIFDEYEKTKSYDKVLEADNAKYQEARNKKIEAIRDIQGKAAALKENEKAKLEKDGEKLINELKAFDQQNRTDLAKARDERVREILMEIEKVVSDYAKKEGYSFVFNDRVMIYGAESMNITEPILTGLNEAYKQVKK
ncbi:MAG: OmpH family outer membrane protein [Candidatus Omnitrophota bacterium]